MPLRALVSLRPLYDVNFHRDISLNVKSSLGLTRESLFEILARSETRFLDPKFSRDFRETHESKLVARLAFREPHRQKFRSENREKPSLATKFRSENRFLRVSQKEVS